MESALAILGGRWRRAAKELGITFQAPYTLVARNGARFKFAGLLPQFGAKRGMLLGCEYDQAAVDTAVAEGFGYSYLSAGEEGAPLQIEGYVDCLRDWGWESKNEQPPDWYGAGVKNAV